MNRIVNILPKGEGFSPAQFGAVALCVRDFTCFSRYRNDVTVTGTLPGPGYAGIRYVALPRVRWFENRTRAYARQCLRVIRAERAGLVEIHNRANMLKMMAPHVACRMALHLHNDPQEIRCLKTPAERRGILAQASAVYCVSDYIRSRFLDGLDEASGAKLHVIYNGLEIPSFREEKENAIVFAGRMTEEKGGRVLAHALRIALPRLEGWKAVLIGAERHSASAARAPYEKAIDAILEPVRAQVDTPGFLSHEATLAHFARSAIAVIPSVWQEPFGRTALEAMAQSCAVISSGRGALFEVTADAALTLSDVTPEALAEAICALAENAPERERLRRLGHLRSQRFSIQACTEALDRARAPLLEARNHAA